MTTTQRPLIHTLRKIRDHLTDTSHRCESYAASYPYANHEFLDIKGKLTWAIGRIDAAIADAEPEDGR